MSSSDARRFVADIFESATLAPADATASAWALDEFHADDLFGGVGVDERAPSVESADAAPTYDPAQLAQVEAEAYARGYSDGDRAGFVRGESAAQQALAQPLATLQAIAAQLSAAEQRWLLTLEENVAALAVAIAQHVIAREVSADPSTVLPLVQQAIAAFPVDQPLTVRVHPDDVQVVQEATSTNALLREIRVAADPAVMRGGALVDGRERIVDGRVDTALERIFRAIGQVQPS